MATAILSIIAVMVAILGGFDSHSYFLHSRLKTSLVAGILGILISAYVSFFLRTLNKNPTTVKVAIVGQPLSGKTVYLSVLFNELLTHKEESIVFQAYGIETIEQVEKNIKRLQGGSWLKPTLASSTFYFRANAILRKGLFSPKYTVEIGDYAGEKSKEFDSRSNEWLHKTEYFKYVITSDIILLAVDGAILNDGKQSHIEEIQSTLVAAIQVLLDEKGLSVDSELNIPVALLIMKSDLLPDEIINSIEDLFSRLINLCTNRIRNFKIFTVSSVGELNIGGTPPHKINPQNVVAPMVWGLRKIRT